MGMCESHKSRSIPNPNTPMLRALPAVLSSTLLGAAALGTSPSAEACGESGRKTMSELGRATDHADIRFQMRNLAVSFLMTAAAAAATAERCLMTLPSSCSSGRVFVNRLRKRPPIKIGGRDTS